MRFGCFVCARRYVAWMHVHSLVSAFFLRVTQESDFVVCWQQAQASRQAKPKVHLTGPAPLVQLPAHRIAGPGVIHHRHPPLHLSQDLCTLALCSHILCQPFPNLSLQHSDGLAIGSGRTRWSSRLNSSSAGNMFVWGQSWTAIEPVKPANQLQHSSCLLIRLMGYVKGIIVTCI